MLEERVVIDASRVVDIPLISCDCSFTAAVRPAVDQLSSALFLLIDASSLLSVPKESLHLGVFDHIISLKFQSFQSGYNAPQLLVQCSLALCHTHHRGCYG